MCGDFNTVMNLHSVHEIFLLTGGGLKMCSYSCLTAVRILRFVIDVYWVGLGTLKMRKVFDINRRESEIWKEANVLSLHVCYS
jgi:hypothetical protein